MRRAPRARGLLAVAACGLLVACATDTLTTGEPRVGKAVPIAPFEFHEECGTIGGGERVDFRFTTTRPVHFEIYYKEGITRIAPIVRENVTEGSGVFPPPVTRRYCLRWDAGREGALVDHRIRILPANPP